MAKYLVQFKDDKGNVIHEEIVHTELKDGDHDTIIKDMQEAAKKYCDAYNAFLDAPGMEPAE